MNSKNDYDSITFNTIITILAAVIFPSPILLLLAFSTVFIFPIINITIA